MDLRTHLLRTLPQLRAAILLQDAMGDWTPDEVEAVVDGAERIRQPDGFVPEVIDLRDAAKDVRYSSTRNADGKVVRLGSVKRRKYAPRNVRDCSAWLIHQMGVERSVESQRYIYVSAQSVIRPDGARILIHPLTVRLVSANAADRKPFFAVNCEVAGNFEGDDGSGGYYKPNVFGSGRASLEQLVGLAYQLNHDRLEVASAGGSLRAMYPHRIFGRNSKGEPNRPICPGSRVYQAAEHVALRLGMRVAEEGEEHGGMPVPPRWRCRIWWAMRGEYPPSGWSDDLTEEEKAALDRAIGL